MYIYIYIQSAYKSINLIIITGISVQRNFYHLELILILIKNVLTKNYSISIFLLLNKRNANVGNDGNYISKALISFTFLMIYEKPFVQHEITINYYN